MSKSSTDAMAKPGKKITVQQIFDRAVTAHKAGELDEAGKLYRLCLANTPANPTTWTNYGALLRSQKKFAASIACHRKALEINPDLINARSNLANALCDHGAADEAADIREQLVAEHPDDWARIRDLAIAYRGCWRNQEAVDLIDATEKRLGTSEPALLQRSLAHLMLGNYAEGFRDFEARYSGDEVSLPENAPWPRWEGQDLNGKRIVILPEQGFGDAILMSRFLPRLKAQGAHVSMVVKPPLQRLFANLDGLDEMLSGASKSAQYDYYSPNMSLPHFAGMPEDGNPPALPRLSIPQDSRERARRIVKPFQHRFKIGIVWTGSLTYRANHRRSTGPDSFLDLSTVPGVQLFSLYKGEAHEDFLGSGMAGLIVDACGNDRDFADTAALIDEMDLMITTDTAVVHVAASMGKPVWNMLTWEGFWLYGSGSETPWYPSMRLYRQAAVGDWTSVLSGAEQDLRKLLGDRA